MIDFSDDIPNVDEAVSDEQKLWVNKYRPRTLAEMCLNDELRGTFSQQIESGDIQNVTLVGPPGTGKTTLAMILANGIGAEVLFVSCAGGEGRIDSIWNKIVPFCQYASESRKVVILDELDSASATQANSFQKALRNIVETYSDCRFVATANYADNIIEPILSRLPPVTLSFDCKQLMRRLVDILRMEKVSVEKDGFASALKKFVLGSFPDVRSIVGKLQFACSSGSLSRERIESLSSFSVEDKDAVDSFYSKVVEIVSGRDSSLQEIRRRVAEFVSEATSNGSSASLAGLSGAYAFSRGLVEYLIHVDAIREPDTIISFISQLESIEKCVDKEIQVFKLVVMAHQVLTRQE